MPNQNQQAQAAASVLGTMVAGPLGGVVGRIASGLISHLFEGKDGIRRRNAERLWNGSSDTVKMFMTKEMAIALSHPERTTEFLINNWIPGHWRMALADLITMRSTGQNPTPTGGGDHLENDPNKPQTLQYEQIALDAMIAAKQVQDTQGSSDVPQEGQGGTSSGGSSTGTPALSFAGMSIWVWIVLIGAGLWIVFGAKAKG